MRDPNSAQQPNNPNSGFDGTADNAADGLINQGLAGIESKIPIPGGQGVDQMINSKVDQLVNNEINTELNKGGGGIIGTIKRLLGM